MFSDFYKSFKRLRSLATIAALRFALDHRTNFLGTLWVLANPLTFVAAISYVYSHVNRLPFNEYLLYLTIGLVTWNMINGFVAEAPPIFVKNRPFLFQGELSNTDIILLQTVQTLIVFAYQSILIIFALVLLPSALSWASLAAVPAIFAVVLNGILLTTIFGTLGARFRDGGQMIAAGMRIVFFATPIMWIANDISGRSRFLAYYINGNPFYHFIEIVRQPLVSGTVPLTSWLVVAGLTFASAAVASLVHRRYSRVVTLWI